MKLTSVGFIFIVETVRIFVLNKYITIVIKIIDLRFGGKTMIKIYGMPTCPYCDYIHEQIKGREDEFEYINIGENIRNMGAFTRLRDTNPAFDHSKEIGDVGIPAFVLEDGSITLDPAVVGLIEYGTPDACSIKDHKSGRKGC